MPDYPRIRSRQEYDIVFKEGKRYSTSSMILYYRENGSGFTRYGYAVGKRVGTSVTRNRVKRRIREAVKQIYDGITGGYDLVIVARREVEFSEIVSGLKRLLSQAGIFKKTV